MAKTFANAITRCRVLLRDPVTRPDGSAITPFHSNDEIIAAVNGAVKNRIGLVEKLFKEFYQTTKDYIGITDAIAATDDEEYKLPGMEGDSSSEIRHWQILRRTDYETKPYVVKVDAAFQEPITTAATGMFAGLYDQYPENLTPGEQSVSIINGTRMRIKPAPDSADQTFTLWYKRVPVDGDETTDSIDGPTTLFELYCHDAAIELKELLNTPLVGVLKAKRDNILRDLEADSEMDQGPSVMPTGPRM